MPEMLPAEVLMEKKIQRVIAAVGLTLGGCASHAYSLPVVTTVQTSSGQADVAWVVEDGIRIVRCVNGPDRPVCRRATVD
jgi:hypothetical protein